jgi:hypothetical protein
LIFFAVVDFWADARLWGRLVGERREIELVGNGWICGRWLACVKKCSAAAAAERCDVGTGWQWPFGAAFGAGEQSG